MIRRVLRLKDVKEATGLSRSSIYALPRVERSRSNHRWACSHRGRTGTSSSYSGTSSSSRWVLWVWGSVRTQPLPAKPRKLKNWAEDVRFWGERPIGTTRRSCLPTVPGRVPRARLAQLSQGPHVGRGAPTGAEHTPDHRVVIRPAHVRMHTRQRRRELASRRPPAPHARSAAARHRDAEQPAPCKLRVHTHVARPKIALIALHLARQSTEHLQVALPPDGPARSAAPGVRRSFVAATETSAACPCPGAPVTVNACSAVRFEPAASVAVSVTADSPINTAVTVASPSVTDTVATSSADDAAP